MREPEVATVLQIPLFWFIGWFIVVTALWVEYRVHRRHFYEPVTVEQSSFSVAPASSTHRRRQSTPVRGSFVYVTSGAKATGDQFSEWNNFYKRQQAIDAVDAAKQDSVAYFDPWMGNVIRTNRFFAHDVIYGGLAMCFMSLGCLLIMSCWFALRGTPGTALRICAAFAFLAFGIFGITVITAHVSVVDPKWQASAQLLVVIPVTVLVAMATLGFIRAGTEKLSRAIAGLKADQSKESLESAHVRWPTRAICLTAMVSVTVMSVALIAMLVMLCVSLLT